MDVKLELMAVGAVLALWSSPTAAEEQPPAAAEEREYEMHCRYVPGFGSECTRRYALLVAGATRTLAGAQKRAEQVQQILITKQLIPDYESRDFRALTLSADGTLRDAAGEPHLPRQAEDDGWYVGIERSAHHRELSPGYFMVVIASNGRKAIWKDRAKARKAGVQSYVRYVSDTITVCSH